jgi:hypothetical protein
MLRAWLLLLLCGAGVLTYIEVASERHFWEVIASFAATDAASAYYRTYAPVYWVEHVMPGHWWLGHGRVLPDMGSYGDITNNYFLVLLYGGLCTLVPFLLVLVIAYQRLYRAAKLAWSRDLTRVCWCVAAALTGVLLVMHTVSLFGQMVAYFSILLALPGALVVVARHENAQRTAWHPLGHPEAIERWLRALARVSGAERQNAETSQV